MISVAAYNLLLRQRRFRLATIPGSFPMSPSAAPARARQSPSRNWSPRYWEPVDGGYRIRDWDLLRMVMEWLWRLHLGPPGRLHLDPLGNQLAPSFGPTQAFLAAPSWQALTAGQGRTSSLRCWRSTLTRGSSPAIRQQSRKASLQDGNGPRLPGGPISSPTSDLSDLRWSHFKPPWWVHLKAP